MLKWKGREEDYMREWRKKNATKILTYSAEWRRENRAKVNAYMAEWKRKNKERVRSYNASRLSGAGDVRASNPISREKRRIAAKRSYALNPLLYRERARASAKRNPEKVKARLKKWKTLNQDRMRLYDHRKRSRKVGGSLSKDLAARLLKLQRGLCACCRSDLSGRYHLDHIVPLALGGPNVDNNIQLLCPTCNMSKHAKHPIEFMQARGFLL